MIGGTTRAIFQAMALRRWYSSPDKTLGMLEYRANQGLDIHNTQLTTGKLLPIIDKTFPLYQSPEAFRYYSSGLVKGKVIITLQK